MKYLNFSAFPKKVRMSLDYKPVLAATNATEFLLTRGSGDYQFPYNFVTTPGLVYLQNFTLY
jgi:hypothetical protein